MIRIRKCSANRCLRTRARAAGDDPVPLAVEGDHPQRGVGGGVVDEAEEGLFGIVYLVVVVAERLGVGLEHAPHCNLIPRDRSDVESAGSHPRE